MKKLSKSFILTLTCIDKLGEDTMLTIKIINNELRVTNGQTSFVETGPFTKVPAVQLAERFNSEFPREESAMFQLQGEPNQELQAFRQEVSEAWNHPVIFESEVTSSIEEALKKEKEKMSWLLRYYGYHPGKDEYAVESLLTTGNGFIGLRGTTPEMKISENHYPATYLAGLYNTAISEVSGQKIKNEDFVNAPNMQRMTLKIDGEELIFDASQIQGLQRTLDMRTGVFASTTRFLTKTGKELEVVAKRVVSMENMHLYALSYQVTPLNFTGEIELMSVSDGGVYNYNVARYRSLTNTHLDVVEQEAVDGKTSLIAQTRQSNIKILQQSELKSETISLDKVTTEITKTAIYQTIPVIVTKGETVTFEKIVSVFMAKEGEKLPEKVLSDQNFPSFDEVKRTSAEAWNTLWAQAEIKVSGDIMSEKMLHLHTYHMLVSGSPVANSTLDASITARGLHGEAYRGHIFWDELFILPFYIIHFPETARQLLLYRYHRLGAAKEAAKKEGYEGAMYPWQSGLDGSEQSQELHLNPITGEWGEDHSRLQRHVSLAVAYNVWLYGNNTNDRLFMVDYGIELLLEIAKFWLSKTTFDEEKGCYSIAGVMGPDEFHEAYPGSQTGGLTDNAYTNMMVVWLFEEIEKIYQTYDADSLKRIQKKVALTSKQLAEMEHIKHNLHLEINSEGIIAQFEGYFDLEEVDWTFYKEKYGNIYRMDRILQAEGRSADEFKVAKQADSLMIFYNLHKSRVDQILTDLQCELPEDYLEKNLAYYLERTSHGSTLSRIVHSQLASIVDDRQLAWKLYQEALRSDYQDIQGGTTAEGIHAGVMAATLFITLTTFAGIDIRQDRIHIQPHFPEQWKELSFKMSIRGINFSISVSEETLEIEADQEATIMVENKSVHLLPAKQVTIQLGE